MTHPDKPPAQSDPAASDLLPTPEESVQGSEQNSESEPTAPSSAEQEMEAAYETMPGADVIRQQKPGSG